MEIRAVLDKDEKRRIARTILETLTDWFEVPEEREGHIRKSADLPFFAAFDGDLPAGFICLRETGRDTAEIYVMGVLKSFHRRGVGRELVREAKAAAKQMGYSFLQVKTVQMGTYPDYDDTNLFYLAMGFKEFEVLPLFWDELNPCQVYVMHLG